jgi:hypothetical protein
MSVAAVWNIAIALIENRYKDAREMIRTGPLRNENFGRLQDRLMSAIQHRVSQEIGETVEERVRLALPYRLDKALHEVLMECLRLSPTEEPYTHAPRTFQSSEEAYYQGVAEVEEIIERHLSLTTRLCDGAAKKEKKDESTDSR